MEFRDAVLVPPILRVPESVAGKVSWVRVGEQQQLEAPGRGRDLQTVEVCVCVCARERGENAAAAFVKVF